MKSTVHADTRGGAGRSALVRASTRAIRCSVASRREAAKLLRGKTQAELHAARRLRRLRRRRQRRAGQADRRRRTRRRSTTATRGYPGRHPRADGGEAARDATRSACCALAVTGMLPKNRSRAPAGDQAQDLRRPGASARGAAAGGHRAAGRRPRLRKESSMAERTVTHAATGKRKTAVARVRLVAGRGQDHRQRAHVSRTTSAARPRA